MTNISFVQSLSKYLNEHVILFLYRFKALKILTNTKRFDWVNNFLYKVQLNLSKKSVYSFYKNYAEHYFFGKSMGCIINKLCVGLNISFYAYLKILFNNYDLVINTLNKFNSEISTKKQQTLINLAKHGIFHTNMFEISNLFHVFIEKYLYKVLILADNYFSLLNTLLFSEGTFIYLPPYTKINVAFGIYFNLFAAKNNQFERTLVIISKNAKMTYVENCVSADYTNFNFHNALIEFILKENAHLYYKTLQNWAYLKYYSRLYGIHNLVFKKIMFLNNNLFDFIQTDLGSDSIIKYPALILLGNNIKTISKTVNINSMFQNINTGIKIYNFGINNVSKFFTKTVNLFKTISFYNLDVASIDKINKYSLYNECNSLLINNLNYNITYPLFSFMGKYIHIIHETVISFIKRQQILLLMQRNYKEIIAYTTLIFKFCEKLLFSLSAIELYNLFFYIYKTVYTHLSVISIF